MYKLRPFLLLYSGLTAGWLIAFGKEEYEYEYSYSYKSEMRLANPGIFSLLHNIINVLTVIFLYYHYTKTSLHYLIIALAFNLANIMFVLQCAYNPISGFWACYQIKTPLTILTLINHYF